MSITYRAALGNIAAAVRGDHCEVAVYEVRDGSDTGSVLMPDTELDVEITDPDRDKKAMADAERVLAAAGWGITGDWEYGDSEIMAPVARAAGTGLSSPSQWDSGEPDAGIWDMVAGLDGVDVDGRPDGVITVTSADGQSKVTFGESRPVEANQEPGGWDWTAYRLDDGMWETAGADWAETDEDMTAALKHYLA